MILKTKLFGHTYEFKNLKEVMAKANEEKSGDILARIAAESFFFIAVSFRFLLFFIIERDDFGRSDLFQYSYYTRKSNEFQHLVE